MQGQVTEVGAPTGEESLYSLNQKKVYTFVKLSTQNRGGPDEKYKGMHHFAIFLTQWWVWRTPYFSSSPPRFWVFGFAASVYFLLVETVAGYVPSFTKPV